MSDLLLQLPEAKHVPQMIGVCRACPGIAQHAAYFFWLFATVYRSCSLLAIDRESVVGYLLAMPTPEPGEIFIIQMAILPEQQKHGAGISMLFEHRHFLKGKGFQKVYASIEAGHEPGFALLHKARQKGYAFLQVPWRGNTSSLTVLGKEEYLYYADLQ